MHFFTVGKFQRNKHRKGCYILILKNLAVPDMCIAVVQYIKIKKCKKYKVHINLIFINSFLGYLEQVEIYIYAL